MKRSSEQKMEQRTTYTENIHSQDDTLVFSLIDTNVSIANGLRRTIVADIPTLAFKTFPYKENRMNITVNTSRLNNEILKQRLACIPIHGIIDGQLPYDELEIVVDVDNDTTDMRLVTTADFKIRNTRLDNYLSDKTVSKIFPPDKITKDFIVLTRLRPRISQNVPGEVLKFTAYMSMHTAGENGAYNVASCCTYMNSPDPIKQDAAWQEYSQTLDVGGSSEIERSDWYNLDGGRIFKKDSFDFKIETVGVYTNAGIVKMGCDVLVRDINAFMDKLIPVAMTDIVMAQSRSTIADSYDLKLTGIGYTIGKILEHLIHENYYKGVGVLTFVGFRKDHPHDNHSTIRIAFKSMPEDVDVNSTIIDILKNVCHKAIQIYTSISEDFN